MLSVYAQGVTQAAPMQKGNMMQFIIMMAILFGIWHFLVIKPEKKKQAEHKAMLGTIGKNDEVITSSGIHGTIVNVKDSTFVLRIDDNVKIEIQKNYVSTVKKKRDKE